MFSSLWTLDFRVISKNYQQVDTSRVFFMLCKTAIDIERLFMNNA